MGEGCLRVLFVWGFGCLFGWFSGLGRHYCVSDVHVHLSSGLGEDPFSVADCVLGLAGGGILILLWVRSVDCHDEGVFFFMDF